MDYFSYLKKMQCIQKSILDYIETEENIDENYEKLIYFFNDQNIFEGPHIFKEIITLILNVSNNHHRTETFFAKIDRIILFFKDAILKNFSNYEIFTIFRKNYRILLFMLKENILKIDISVFSKLKNKTYRKAYYPNYFIPEFRELLAEKDKIKSKRQIPDPSKQNIGRNSEEFERKREIAENDDQICEIIRKDSVEDFISYISNSSYSLTSTVGSSIFETNAFLINKNPTLIEYAAFYGSLKIFNYLIENEIELTPSLWLFAVHGQKMELLHILENNKIMPEDMSYKNSLLESIACHHIEMTEYIMKKVQRIDKKAIIEESVRYNNYEYFPVEMIVNPDIFYELCKYDYISIVEFFLKEKIDFNQTKI